MYIYIYIYIYTYIKKRSSPCKTSHYLLVQCLKRHLSLSQNIFCLREMIETIDY